MMSLFPLSINLLFIFCKMSENGEKCPPQVSQSPVGTFKLLIMSDQKSKINEMCKYILFNVTEDGEILTC